MALFRCGNSESVSVEYIEKVGRNIENAVVGDYYVICSASAPTVSDISGATMILPSTAGGASLIQATATTVALGDRFYAGIIHISGNAKIVTA